LPEYTQENRLIQIITPLGDDVLLLQSFSGEEGISRLFHFDLRMQSVNRSISFDSIIGKKATIRMILDKTERYINGIISSFSQGAYSTTFASYQATLVPWPWFLTRTADCRIFQDSTVPEIIQQVFQEHRFMDFSLEGLRVRYPKREYCVQYRETYFNFVSRLMEEEGICYFFKHEKDKHTLMLADSPSDFKSCEYKSDVSYETIVGEDSIDEVVTQWSHGQQVQPGNYKLNDFNFEQPALDLIANVDGVDERKYEVFDYPGSYVTKDEGERIVGVRMQEEDTSRIIATGASYCRGFVSGYKFKLKDHYRRELNKEYTLTSVYHSCDQGTNYRSSEGEAAQDFSYSNHFQCIPWTTTFRPPRVTPEPVVHGSQTAMVVGPPGEEIYVDKYGRVKVQFHWDRVGKYNEKSSCWVRVSQNWAGKRWGAMFWPRIGQEVIVDFLEGDPDYPIVTGRVYNGASMPPYALPDQKTKSGVKTYSSKGGGGFNEFRFEDKKGQEQIFIQAEKNEDIRIKNDKMEWIGNDSHLIIKHDHLEEVDGDKHLHVKGDQNEKVDGTVSLKAGQDVQEKVGTKYALDAGNEIHLKAGMNVVIEAGTTLTIKVGSNFININSGGIFIKGNMVFVNSGGAAGVGAGSSPEAPKPPKEADKAEPGEKPEMPPPKRPRTPVVYSPAALVMKQAARDGTPFCDI
jgi:type VI secretion system secreted protein VgrG